MSGSEHNFEEIEKGMAIYDYIVNNVDTCKSELDTLISDLNDNDSSGQFLASTARFLAAVDRKAFEAYIPRLIEAAIYKDRERRYIGQLPEAIWGADYEDHIEELQNSDDLFRRLYKRIHPSGIFN